MIEKNSNLPEDALLSMEYTIESARKYEKKRFNKGKMLKYDKFEKAFAQLLFKMVGSDSHIVDIPCGNGRFFEVFSKARKLVMADYSINMLQACEEKFGTQDNIRLIQADILSIPLPDGWADLCFCMRLFHHINNDERRLSTLKELARVSRKFVAMSFYNHNLRFYRRKILGRKITGNYTTYNRLSALAKQAGLEPVKRFPKVNFFTEQCLVIFKKAQAF
jgi:ubiquinone/menaquinone biosynthesis C-methylase UbiE